MNNMPQHEAYRVVQATEQGVPSDDDLQFLTQQLFVVFDYTHHNSLIGMIEMIEIFLAQSSQSTSSCKCLRHLYRINYNDYCHLYCCNDI